MEPVHIFTAGAILVVIICALWATRKRSEPWLIDRVAVWWVDNGASGEYSIGDSDEMEAFDYVRKRLMVDGVVRREDRNMLHIQIEERWSS